MNRDNEENSMVTGLQYEEGIERPEPDDDYRESALYVDPTIDKVEHDFPIATKLRALTLKIDDAIKAVRGSLFHGKQA